jgi:hypothetical protein
MVYCVFCPSYSTTSTPRMPHPQTVSVPSPTFPSTAHLSHGQGTSSASFYVPTLPGLRQGPNINHHLNMYAGHISSDPNATHAAATDITAHLFFVLVKARRVADKERIMFWFNVLSQISPSGVNAHASPGWPWVLVDGRVDDGSRSVAIRRTRRNDDG